MKREVCGMRCEGSRARGRLRLVRCSLVNTTHRIGGRQTDQGKKREGRCTTGNAALLFDTMRSSDVLRCARDDRTPLDSALKCLASTGDSDAKSNSRLHIIDIDHLYAV